MPTRPHQRVSRLWRRVQRGWQHWRREAARLAPYVRPRTGRLVLSGAFGLGYTTMRLLEPWIMALVIDHVVLDRPLPRFLSVLPEWARSGRLTLLYVLVAGLLAIALVRGVLYYYHRLLAARVGQEVTADLRLDLYAHLQHLSFAFHDRRRTGDVLTRLTSDTRLLRDIFIALPLALGSELFLMAGMIAVMALMDWTLALVALSAIPAVALVLQAFQRPMRQAIRRQREREGHLANLAAESLGAIRVVQSFRREKFEIERFGSQNRRGLREGLKAARLEARLRWSADLIVAIVVGIVLTVATRKVLANALSPGDLIVFVAYLRAFIRPISQVSRMAERAARGAAAGERVFNLLRSERAIHDRQGAVPAPRVREAVEFDDVSLDYRPGGRVLSDISIRIPAGARIGIIGPTGSGKSSLLSLIPRFYDPSSGAVRIDGVDVRDMALSSLRKRVSVVFQEPILFAASIAENIGYGRPGATRDQIVEAAREAHVHSIIDALPDGYETIVGERGGTLSGGERQCITIARALIKDAPLVLLDEPLSGLDARAAALVTAALERLMQGRTVVLVTHDRHGLLALDRLYVLRGGLLVDEGTPAEILSRHDLRGDTGRSVTEEIGA